MWEVGQGLLGGFATAVYASLSLLALIGAILGTITGVLPGLGPLGPWPFSLFHFDDGCHGAMILFAGIYYGAMYGGSTTSIL